MLGFNDATAQCDSFGSPEIDPLRRVSELGFNSSRYSRSNHEWIFTGILV